VLIRAAWAEPAKQAPSTRPVRAVARASRDPLRHERRRRAAVGSGAEENTKASMRVLAAEPSRARDLWLCVLTSR
jgi:hypothetical protein